MVSCTVCDGESRRIEHEISGFAIARCLDCGMVYAARHPSEQELSALYDSDGYFRGDEWYRDYLGHEESYRRLARRVLERIRRQLPLGGRLLDVGSAAGFMLDEAQNAGFDVLGVEPNARMGAWARERFGVAVRTGTFPSAAEGIGPFDVVTFGDSLEHLIDPRAALEAARALLSPGGLIAIHTPNVDSRLAHWLGRRWPHFTPPEHLWFFAPATLTRLLGRTGFRVLEQRTLGHWWSLCELSSRLLRAPTHGWQGPLLYLDVGDLFVLAHAA